MKFDDARIRAMLRGRREVRLVPLPGFGVSDEPVLVGIRILTEEEIDDSRAEAQQYVIGLAKKHKLDAREMLSLDAEVLDREIQRQQVFRAFLEPEKNVDEAHKPFFVAPSGVRQLDSVMQQTLIKLYEDHQNYVDPHSALDEEEVAELVEALGKEQGVPAVLGLFDAPTLRIFVHSLAARLHSLPTGK